MSKSSSAPLKESQLSCEPIRAFHGSGEAIDKFDFSFTDKGNDQLGSGFYFSSVEDDARMYALKSDKSPTMHVVDLHIKNPMTSDLVQKLSLAQVRKIISAAPELDERLEDYGDVSFEGREKVFSRACAQFSRDSQLMNTFNCMANDFFPGQVGAFNKAISSVTGYDGVIAKFDNGTTHYVAWFPEQIKIVEVKPVVEQEAAPTRRSFKP